MGRGGGKNKKGRSKKNQATPSSQNQPAAASANDDGFILVDPSRIRFQFSRIRPYFSGCGRSVVSTLESIRSGEMAASELPPIQVIVGLDEEDGEGPWYFSLNNRRLWVLKRCKEEGLLENGLVSVRVREPKSKKEADRYTLKNCALEAKFIREKDPNAKDGAKDRKSDLDSDAQHCANKATNDGLFATESAGVQDEVDQSLWSTIEGDSEPDDNDSGSSDGEDGYINRFSLLM